MIPGEDIVNQTFHEVAVTLREMIEVPQVVIMMARTPLHCDRLLLLSLSKHFFFLSLQQLKLLFKILRFSFIIVLFVILVSQVHPHLQVVVSHPHSRFGGAHCIDATQIVPLKVTYGGNLPTNYILGKQHLLHFSPHCHTVTHYIGTSICE
jgi:preprotein translocase subunit SecY